MRKRDRKDNVDFAYMCIIQNELNEVLVQNRIKSWKGLSFPGGHLDFNEPATPSIIRDIKGKTGLTVSDIKLYALKHAFYRNAGKYIVYLYKTNKFTGELISTDEEENFWISVKKLKSRKKEFAENFKHMLDILLNYEKTSRRLKTMIDKINLANWDE